jgi:sterol desaturase/sphingolipid hydroxylase (fatty acid hydroxylase superfamily)
MRSSSMMNAYDYVTTVAFVLSVMAAVALLEVAVPLFVRPATPSRRRRANLAMTLQALLFAFVLTASVTAAAVVLPLASPGLLASTALPAAAQLVLGIVALDFAYGYLAHRTMHMAPALWRFHRVHHSDPSSTSRRASVRIRSRLRGDLWLFVTVWILGAPWRRLWRSGCCRPSTASSSMPTFVSGRRSTRRSRGCG